MVISKGLKKIGIATSIDFAAGLNATFFLEVVSKPQIAFKSKAQLDEKAEHIQ